MKKPDPKNTSTNPTMMIWMMKKLLRNASDQRLRPRHILARAPAGRRPERPLQLVGFRFVHVSIQMVPAASLAANLFWSLRPALGSPPPKGCRDSRPAASGVWSRIQSVCPCSTTFQVHDGGEVVPRSSRLDHRRLPSRPISLARASAWAGAGRLAISIRCDFDGLFLGVGHDFRLGPLGFRPVKTLWVSLAGNSMFLICTNRMSMP